MGRQKQKQRGLSKKDTVFLLCISAAFLIGGLLGFAAAMRLGQSGDAALSDYIGRYLESLQSGVDQAVSKGRVVWNAVRFPLLVILLGFTFFGMVGIPFVLMVRGFLLAFSVTWFVQVFGKTGGALAFLLLGASGVAAIPALFVLSILGMDMGRSLWLRQKNGKRDGFVFDRTAATYLFFCAALVTGSVLFDFFLSPALLRTLAGIL